MRKPMVGTTATIMCMLDDSYMCTIISYMCMQAAALHLCFICILCVIYTLYKLYTVCAYHTLLKALKYTEDIIFHMSMIFFYNLNAHQ